MRNARQCENEAGALSLWIIRNIMDTKVVVYHIAGMIKTESERHTNTLLSMIEKEHTCANKMCSSITLL